MKSNLAKKKVKKDSFIERALYNPKTYKYIESFFERRNKEALF